MSYSNSSLNTFASCMAKYQHHYILHTPKTGMISPHLTFGSMAHDCLYKAGLLRDDVADGVVTAGDYYSVIPSEVLHDDLKQAFQIRSWEKYFLYAIKQIAIYEKELIATFEDEPYTIEREVKMCMTADEVEAIGIPGVNDSLVGIIDLVIRSKTKAVIIDYKFSVSQKTQDNFDMDSQLPLYAFFINSKYGIPIRNILYGYIDIPKTQFGDPTILSNGTLSRAKDQNVSADFYEKAVIAIHGENHEKFNCLPGGYYHDVWCNLALKKAAYLNVQYCDQATYAGVLGDLFDTARMITRMKQDKLPFLRKYDTYACKGCEYLIHCKPWLTSWPYNN